MCVCVCVLLIPHSCHCVSVLSLTGLQRPTLLRGSFLSWEVVQDYLEAGWRKQLKLTILCPLKFFFIDLSHLRRL